MNLPEAFGTVDNTFLYTLMVGLAGYEDSLYRAWLMAHSEDTAQTAEGDDDTPRMLSFYGYSQNTGLLMEINNWLGRLATSLLVDEHGEHMEFHPILPPGAVADEQPITASFENAMEFVGV